MFVVGVVLAVVVAVVVAVRCLLFVVGVIVAVQRAPHCKRLIRKESLMK